MLVLHIRRRTSRSRWRSRILLPMSGGFGRHWPTCPLIATEIHIVHGGSNRRIRLVVTALRLEGKKYVTFTKIKKQIILSHLMAISKKIPTLFITF